jgi:hypothetical protein
VVSIFHAPPRRTSRERGLRPAQRVARKLEPELRLGPTPSCVTGPPSSALLASSEGTAADPDNQAAVFSSSFCTLLMSLEAQHFGLNRLFAWAWFVRSPDGNTFVDDRRPETSETRCTAPTSYVLELGEEHARVMATNLEHVAEQVVTALPLEAVRNFWSRATRSIQTAMCGLQGHDPLLQVSGGRMFLRCTSCGHETPGWTTSPRAPRLRYSGDGARHRLN